MNNIINKIKKSLFLSLPIVGVGAALLTACTDTWDDHYAVQTNGDGTLWEAISNNKDLSNFQAVLKATGYDVALNGSQVFTIFAPTNTELTDFRRDSLIQRYQAEKSAGVKDKKNSVITEFVQNHIALYNYSVSSQMPDTTINMMNGKAISFTKSQYAGQDYLKTNVSTANGILYTIGSIAHYVPSVYEYLSKDADLDSVWQYLSAYSLEEFQPEKSVPGEIIDGKTHYLDSVTVTKNEIIESKTWLNAKLNDEDSTYWMVVPTNEAWKEQFDKNLTYFQYDKKVAERDSFMTHFPRVNILTGAIFSATRNPKIFAADNAAATDSVMSTNAIGYTQRKKSYGSYDKKYYQYTDPYGEGGVFNGTTNVTCSNGRIMKASTWNIDRKNTFLREIVMEAEAAESLDSLNIESDNNKKGNFTQPLNIVNVATTNPFYGKVSGDSYAVIQPAREENFQRVVFNVRNVLSNVPYDVYVVIAPATAGDTLATETQKLPTLFRTVLQCHNAEGIAYYYGPDSQGNATASVYTGNDEKKGPAAVATKSTIAVDKLTNDPTKVDSVFVGTYTFPTSSYGTSEAQVKMVFDSRPTSSNIKNGDYNRILRLDCIVFKPHEEE